MKNILLTALLIAAAVASGDLLAQATAKKVPASRTAALVVDKARFGVSEVRPRAVIARLDSGATTAE